MDRPEISNDHWQASTLNCPRDVGPLLSWAIVLRQKWSRGQVEARFADMPPCLVGMEAELVRII